MSMASGVKDPNIHNSSIRADYLDSPPLMKIEPRWKPSSSPHHSSPYSDSDESTETDTSEANKSRPKRIKFIATQGDAVLLSLLSSGNGITTDVP